MANPFSNGRDYSAITALLVHLGSISVTLVLFVSYLTGCQSETDQLTDISGYYSGTFTSTGRIKTNQDTVYLNIADGGYVCCTKLPFDYGAGIVEIYGSTINFVDTLFFPIPALYADFFSLSGNYNFFFNGRDLLLLKNTDSGKLTYRLKKE